MATFAQIKFAPNRFWFYLKKYESVYELKQSLKKYFEFYNRERLHQSLNYKAPEEIFLVA